MAEMPRQLSQAEIDRILFLQSKGLDPRGRVPTQSIQNLQQRTSGTVTPVSPNVAQLAAGGAERVGKFVNQLFPNAEQLVAANPLNLERLFPTTNAQPQVTIPTGFNFAPKQAPTGEVIPGGLQTNQVNVNQLLSAIKPADVLGLTGAQQAYTDVGMGRAPKPMDVLDTLALGAGGMAAGKGLLGAAKGLKNAPVGLSVQDAPGLLQAAPKSDIGFYSAVEQAALASPRKSATGQAFLNDIMKGPDVRADEIKWMGLDDYLKGKQNVTKQEVQDYIANNRVDVQEVRSTIPRLPGEEMPGDKGAFLPKFGQYTLPGGENYRELLLTMPTNVTKLRAEADRISKLTNPTPEEIEIFKAANRLGDQEYRSTHFPDQRNILAHLRVNDRVDADGKKMLLIEEVQSDWHQAGREKGYAGADKVKGYQVQINGRPLITYATKAEAESHIARANALDPEQKVTMSEIDASPQLINEFAKGKVPDAPFKDTWYQLALKRAIQHAAENGYDRIGLTTGSQQAARFDLSKQISELHYSGTNLVAYDKAGNQVIQKTGVAEADLPGLIGKEAAKKLMEQPKQGTLRSLVGQELQVGGEGMKKYYDEIYPKFLDKYGKKWGARVGETKIKIGEDVVDQAMMAPGIGLMGETTVRSAPMETIRYIDITPEMKAGVSKGQPLFQAAPIIGTGLLGSQQEER